MRLILSVLWIFSCSLGYAQFGTLNGIVYNGTTGQPLSFAEVFVENTNIGCVSNDSGYYVLQLDPGKYNIEYSALGFETQILSLEFLANKKITLNITLKTSFRLIDQITVTGSKFEKKVSEETVSLQVIDADLVSNTGTQTIDRVLDKAPGVNIIGKQANIRGGSGFSYGAGSRVLLLLDDLPILTGDAAFPNWDLIPVESVEQIEIIKGAASALYGSSAMNGIINVRTKYATNRPETTISYFTGFLSNPSGGDTFLQYNPTSGNLVVTGSDTLLGGKNWWGNEQPFFTGFSLMHKQKIRQWDIVGSTYLLGQNGYLYGDYNRKARLSFNIRYRFKKIEGLHAILGSHLQTGQSGSFLFWNGVDQKAYQPFIGTNTTNDIDRMVVDPALHYYGKNGNRFKLMGRYYKANSRNLTRQSTLSDMIYGEAQFQRRMDSLGMVLTAGAILSSTNVDAELYQNPIDSNTLYKAFNTGAYIQIDQKLMERINVSIGARYEVNKIGSKPGYDTAEFEARPVFRTGVNYRLFKATYLRASYGEGYRFPTIAESYVRTNLGPLGIFPNDTLSSEHGWTAEIGLKQGFQIFEDFQGFLDIAVFQQKYFDMMEFSFGYNGLLGFQSVNVGNTEIKGMEFTLAGTGPIRKLPTTVLAGYTFIDPVFQDFDSFQQINTTNDSTNILKYRFKHSVKWDVESSCKKWSLGIGGQYVSHMDAIDQLFLLVIPGLQSWEANHKEGTTVWSTRLGYQMNKEIKFHLICDNLFNKEYSFRPAIIEPPRSFTLKVKAVIK